MKNSILCNEWGLVAYCATRAPLAHERSECANGARVAQ